MELNRLYNIANNEHIQIHDWHIKDCNGIYLNYDKINVIALNYDELSTYIDEKCTLAEELGHYYMDAKYNYLTTDNVLKSKQEYRAKKWRLYVSCSFRGFKISHFKSELMKYINWLIILKLQSNICKMQ